MLKQALQLPSDVRRNAQWKDPCQISSNTSHHSIRRGNSEGFFAVQQAESKQREEMLQNQLAALSERLAVNHASAQSASDFPKSAITRRIPSLADLSSFDDGRAAAWRGWAFKCDEHGSSWLSMGSQCKTWLLNGSMMWYLDLTLRKSVSHWPSNCKAKFWTSFKTLAEGSHMKD